MIFNATVKWISKVILKISSPNTIHSFRVLERNSTKLLKVLAHRLFNETCLNNSLLPTYTNMYMLYIK